MTSAPVDLRSSAATAQRLDNAIDPVEADIPRRASTLSLRSVAIRGSLWTLVGESGTQGLRFISNLILTRLLMPEAFGLMLIVNTVFIGLRMFSEVGTAASIIQHKRGEEASFINTAWSIQVIRGIVLSLVALALAWPVARFYEADVLLFLILVTALNPLMDGLNSKAVAVMHRRMELGRLTLYELGLTVVGFVVQIVLALVMRSVWAIVLGGLVATLCKIVASHTIIARHTQVRSKLGWERTALHDMVRFGRWIFISTALTFVLGHGDKLILGKFLTKEELAFYAIAFYLAFAVRELMSKINSRVMFPIYAEVSRSSPETMALKMHRARRVMMAVAVPAFASLAVLGDWLVTTLYDDRYHQAGWMLQVLASTGIFAIITESSSPILLARGDSFRHMVLLVGRSIMLVGAMSLGGFLGGMHGFVIGVASATLIEYPLVAWAVHRYGVWMPKLDVLAIVGSAVLIGLGFVAMQAVGS